MTKKKILNIKFLSAGLLLVLIGIAVWLTLSGRIVVVWKQPAGQVAIINASVCNDSVVTTYNNAALSQQRGGSSEYTIDKTALNSLVTDIKNKPDYQSDPTCQTILMLTAVTDANYEAAKTAYTVVKDLHDKHQY